MIASPMAVRESGSESDNARADLRARGGLGFSGIWPTGGEGGWLAGMTELRTLDWPRLLARGGGGVLALVTVAFAGLYLPGLVRLGLVVAGILTVKLMGGLADGPVRGMLRPALGLVVTWLALAWGLGLLQPIVAVALLILVGLEARLWWEYREATAGTAAEEPASPPRALTPDERLDALLAEAPLEGLAFGEIAEAMAPYMVRSTVAAKLKQRAWSLGKGRWRARPAGIDEP